MEQTEKTKENFIDSIEQKIEEIYQRKDKDGKPTGKGFITHLIRSYFPIDKVHKVFDSPNKDLKCAITGEKLCTIEDAFAALYSNGMDKKIIENLQASLRGEPAISPIKEQLKGKILAFTGKDTTTMLCLEAVQAFIQWYQNKVLTGDKHVVWVFNDMKRKSVISVIREKLPESEDQKNIDHLEKMAKKPKKASMSLGDLSVLQQLQAKLKQQENGTSN